MDVDIGVVAPFDFTRDRELRRWVPAGVSLHIARTPEVTGADNLSTVSALGAPSCIAEPTRQVCAAGAQAVVYACTSCSFVAGPRGEAALREAMLAHGAPRALTTSGAAVDALRALEVTRVAAVHPHEEPVGRRLRRYLGDAGFDVVANTPLGLPVADALNASPEQVAALVRNGDRPAADAVFVSCTALPTQELIAPLEQELGKPVVTANQVTIWAALRALGLAARGAGQALLAVT